ncbi:MAG: DUF4145 domain-containing protein [Ignavibacteria bacterium]|nr:DUF4145 domain-containing protein [Ignavibacteria bacterium]
MKCLHCLIEFHANEERTFICEDADESWYIYTYKCPSCKKANLYLVNTQTIRTPKGTILINSTKNTKSKTPVRPKGSNRPPCPPEVPIEFSKDYNEACITLFDSSKASAALSRRCLQSILREKGEVKHSSLANEIQEIIDKNNLPSHILDIIDAVRNIGNFAAHPIKSTSTGEIVDVDPEEAEWNLDVLEALFDFYFVQPSKIQKKKNALNKKLSDSGKNHMK